MTRYLSIAFALRLLFTPALADEVINRYEGDVHPLDPAAGWILNTVCEDPCTEYLEDGHFVFFWAVAGGWAAYTYWINIPPVPPPPSLWVEWRYRSNHPWGGVFRTCDGFFSLDYDHMHDKVYMYGDTAISFEVTVHGILRKTCSGATFLAVLCGRLRAVWTI